MDNKKFLSLVQKHFTVNDGGDYVELETWTDGGVNMLINLDKGVEESYLEQFETYIRDYQVDEQIDLHRVDHNYRNDFTIRESLCDFEAYEKRLQGILSECLETTNEMSVKQEDIDERFSVTLKVVGLQGVALGEEGSDEVFSDHSNVEVMSMNIGFQLYDYQTETNHDVNFLKVTGEKETQAKVWETIYSILKSEQ